MTVLRRIGVLCLLVAGLAAAEPLAADPRHRAVRNFRPADTAPAAASPADAAPAPYQPARQNHAGPVVFSTAVALDPVVHRVIAEYSTNVGRAWIARAVQRGEPYRVLIMERLAAAELPRELYYLALVESEFVVRAVSRSGAAGVWQFMPNSVWSGTRMDDWVDDRFDVVQSTDAAVAKLAYNYSVLGDWLLAMAAYNAGLNRVLRAIADTGLRSFWELRAAGALPAETAAYVPKILAVAALAEYAGRNGIVVRRETDPQWVRIDVPGPLDLAVLDSRLFAGQPVLQDANAGHKTGFIWSDRSALTVPRVAVAAIQQFIADEPAGRRVPYTVRSGDTLYGLARTINMPVQAILAVTPGLTLRPLQIGQRIYLPLAVDPAGAPSTTTTAVDRAGAFVEYAVVAGDTLWAIAGKHNTSVETLVATNALDMDGALTVGRTLRIPVAVVDNPPAADTTTNETGTPPPAPAEEARQ